MNHIAIVGTMHSGKTTLANALVERDYQRIGLADAVKDIAAQALNEIKHAMAEEYGEHSPHGYGFFDVHKVNEHKAVLRPFLQWLGTDLARQFLYDDEVWIRAFRREVEWATKPVVCDDVRFPNEAAALKGMGFTVIRIHRPEEDRLASLRAAGMDLSNLSHASEIQVEEIETNDHWHCQDIEQIAYVADILSGRRPADPCYLNPAELVA